MGYTFTAKPITSKGNEVTLIGWDKLQFMPGGEEEPLPWAQGFVEGE